MVWYCSLKYSIGVNVVLRLIERIEKGFGMLTLFKIIPAQNKPTCGSCASLSKYVKKILYFFDTKLSKMRWFSDRKAPMRCTEQLKKD